MNLVGINFLFMCFDASTMTKKAKHYASRYGKEASWDQVKLKFSPTYHVNGFYEPDLLVITNERPDEVSLHQMIKFSSH